ncbi:hypothetical protein FS837_012908 [Tulasnella sp. UAMH 9824]|nr:hypothetical protein FS837_012908 [Tulasnella sp. UAMH 9824]
MQAPESSIATLPPYPPKTSILNLPLEIVVMIFQWLIDITPVWRHAESRSLPRLVCQHWRRIVDDTPTLWTSLINAPLALAFANSKELRLRVTETGRGSHVTSPERKFKRLRQISSVAHRIATLNLQWFSPTDLVGLLSPVNITFPIFPLLSVLLLANIALTREQWQRLLEASHGLQSLGFHYLSGELADQTAPMDSLALPVLTKLACTIDLIQLAGFETIFGVQWSQLRNVLLQVECSSGRTAIRLHAWILPWAMHWLDQGIRRSMTTRMRLKPPTPNAHQSVEPSSIGEISGFFDDDPTIRFELITVSRITNGIHPSLWHQSPLLNEALLPGQTHLLIHPAHRLSMRGFNPKLLVKGTKPSTVTIGDPAHPLAPVERGNWLRRLWKARIQGKGWGNIESIQTEGSDPATELWVAHQCTWGQEDANKDWAPTAPDHNNDEASSPSNRTLSDDGVEENVIGHDAPEGVWSDEGEISDNDEEIGNSGV